MKTQRESFAQPGPMGELWNGFIGNRSAVAGVAVFMAICILAVGADFIAPHSPEEINPARQYAPPGFLEGGSAEYPLGTDQLGRCVLSRMMHGARYSLAVGFMVVVLSLTVAVVLGLIAAVAGAWSTS